MLRKHKDKARAPKELQQQKTKPNLSPSQTAKQARKLALSAYIRFIIQTSSLPFKQERLKKKKPQSEASEQASETNEEKAEAAE